MGKYNSRPEAVPVDFDDLLLVSKIVTSEAGSNWLSDEHQQLVASVLLNRVASPEFPDTIYNCAYQKGQYASGFKKIKPNERSVKNALYILENGSIAPPDVVFQSNNPNLGSGIWKEIPDEHLRTSYFNYSNYRNLYKEADPE